MQITLPDLDKHQLNLFSRWTPSVPVRHPEANLFNERFLSEITLSGHPSQCLNLLAPILRALSDDSLPQQQNRWLTLIAPPVYLTTDWLRRSGLNRERILLLQARTPAETLPLACQMLRLGHSHTVVNWMNPLTMSMREQLLQAARQGETQSLNIRLS